MNYNIQHGINIFATINKQNISINDTKFAIINLWNNEYKVPKNYIKETKS